jgi:chemotaxis protein CheX
MNATGTSLAANDQQNWLPMLDVAVREVFELMLGCKLHTADPTSNENLDVTAMVGLAGQLCGVLSMRCNRQTAALMAAKMLGSAPDENSPETYDAFGEVCNMVAGNFKNKIAKLGDGCMLSVPTVITGAEYTLHSLGNSVALEFTVLFEKLPVVVSLQVNS